MTYIITVIIAGLNTEAYSDSATIENADSGSRENGVLPLFSRSATCIA